MSKGERKYKILSDEEKELIFSHYMNTGNPMKYYAAIYNISIQKASKVVSDMFEKRNNPDEKQ